MDLFLQLGKINKAKNAGVTVIRKVESDIINDSLFVAHLLTELIRELVSRCSKATILNQYRGIQTGDMLK